MQSRPDLSRVETQAELAMAQQLGCKNIQGYCDGRPIGFADSLGLFQMPRRVVA
jgi:EAL domain-containing protein (putative c-di-GMP-specific phosphodiesterase class I)